jgi:hypothetical protein
MHNCAYCLCRVCSKVRCPRGKYHCLPCYHGTVLDCPFFVHKKMTRVYRIKKRSPAVTVDDLRKLKDTIDLILSEDMPIESHKTLQAQLAEEEQRHKAALRNILQNSNKSG